VKIMTEPATDGGRISKGFGFVCFKLKDDAQTAIDNAPLKLFQGRTLYVSHFEDKKQREYRIKDNIDQSSFENFGGSYPKMQNAVMDFMQLLGSQFSLMGGFGGGSGGGQMNRGGYQQQQMGRGGYGGGYGRG
jgi:hypothetical protein